jgi:hypothetical protein
MSDIIVGTSQMSTIESTVHTFFHSVVSSTRVVSYSYDNLLACLPYIGSLFSLHMLSPPCRNI